MGYQLQLTHHKAVAQARAGKKDKEGNVVAAPREDIPKDREVTPYLKATDNKDAQVIAAAMAGNEKGVAALEAKRALCKEHEGYETALDNTLKACAAIAAESDGIAGIVNRAISQFQSAAVVTEFGLKPDVESAPKAGRPVIGG